MASSADRPQVAIIGAGIAGSVLASILRRRKIPTILIDKAVPAPSLTYACSLQKRAHETLVAALSASAGDKPLAKSIGLASASTTSTLGDVYVHRGVLGELLRERAAGVTHAEAQSITTHPLTVTLSDGQVLRPQVLVAADGPHSAVRSLLHMVNPQQPLPYVVIRGTRRYQGPPPFEIPSEAHVISGVRLAASVVKSPDSDEHTLSFTYSRPSQGDEDKIHNPYRPLTNARSIPEAFYEEVDALQTLPSPFDEIFNAQTLRGDRLLHWVMRSGVVPLETLEKAAADGVVFVGDAVHPMPILGTTGANVAVHDAVRLADIIASDRDLKDFARESYDGWREAVDAAEVRIQEYHTSA